MSILETHYLRNVVGDTEIRKGEGMELDQLFHNTSYLREAHAQIHPFELGSLNEAFHFRDTSFINLPSVRNRLLQICLRSYCLTYHFHLSLFIDGTTHGIMFLLSP